MLRVPCDLDLAGAASREEAEHLYAEQARALRDAIQAADTVLAVWRDALVALAESPVGVDRSIELRLNLPAHRLMPVALVDREHHLTVAPVCSARTLARGLPPMGIACAQQDVAHVYPLPDDPERCLTDFAERAADHARRVGEQLDKQDASVAASSSSTTPTASVRPAEAPRNFAGVAEFGFVGAPPRRPHRAGRGRLPGDRLPARTVPDRRERRARGRVRAPGGSGTR
jgi:hypothetical protein